MSVLENLKEKIEDTNKQIAYNLEIIKNKKRDIEDLNHAQKETILSLKEDLKKEMFGKIYETESFRFNFILDINEISNDGFLLGNSLDINFFLGRNTSTYGLFGKRENNYICNVSYIKNIINDPDLIYNRIENEILKTFDYFLLRIKNHHNLVFINNYLDNGNSYDCIVDEEKSYSLSLNPKYGIALNLDKLNIGGKQIKRVKASDINVNQVFYDFYKRSVEFCKNIFKDYLALYNASNA